jgi:hypothetical protein
LSERLARIVAQGEMPQIDDDLAVVFDHGDLVNFAADPQTPAIEL